MNTPDAKSPYHARWVWAVLVLLNMPVCIMEAWQEHHIQHSWQFGLLLPCWMMFTLFWSRLEGWALSWAGDVAVYLLRTAVLMLAASQITPILQLFAGMVAEGMLGPQPTNALPGLLHLFAMMTLTGALLSLCALVLPALALLLWRCRRAWA